MSIDLHIDDKIKSGIHSNAFVNFGAFLYDERRNDITDDQAALASKPKPVPTIQTMDQWLSTYTLQYTPMSRFPNIRTDEICQYRTGYRKTVWRGCCHVSLTKTSGNGTSTGRHCRGGHE